MNDKFMVPRLEDLPYNSSPPIQFIYESNALLTFGLYLWSDNPSPLTPNRPLLDNALYFFRNVTLTADIEQLDFTANLITAPQFFMFLRADSNAPLLREPLIMNSFYQQFDYRYTWKRQLTSNQLFCAFRGSLIQGATLLGKPSIDLKAIISAQEIVDEEFIDRFQKAYPKGGKNE